MKLKLTARLLVSALAIAATALGPGTAAAAAAESCAVPAPVTVPSSGTVVGTGTAASCTQGALRAAVAAGGWVRFRCGAGRVTIAVTSQIHVPGTTVIDGGGTVTLDGGHRNRILDVGNGATLSVRRMRFTNGAAAQSMDRPAAGGGAIAASFRGRLEIMDSTFSGNTAGLGGGAVFGGPTSSVTVVRSSFSGNNGWLGGALYTLLAPLTVVDSTFTGNSTTASGGIGDGGAIATDGAAPVPGKTGGVVRICGSVIAHNTSQGVGGGAYLWTYAPDRIVIDRTSFFDNTVKSGDGGGARISTGPEPGEAGSITITRSSFLANTSGRNAGGLDLDCAPTCALSNTTFYNNKAGGYGGAIFGSGHHDNNMTFADNSAAGMGGALFGDKLVVNNSVFTGNAAHNPWQIAMNCSSLAQGSHVVQWLADKRDTGQSCVTGAIARDPRLAAPSANGGPTLTMMPAANSPLLSAGAGCASTDQRGVHRPTSRCDIGAVERTAYTAAATSLPSPSTASDAAADRPTAFPHISATVSASSDGSLLAATGTSTRADMYGAGGAALAATGTAVVFMGRRRRKPGRR